MSKTYYYFWAFVMFTVSFILTLIWFDWRLFVILILFGWGNNLQHKGDQS